MHRAAALLLLVSGCSLAFGEKHTAKPRPCDRDTLALPITDTALALASLIGGATLIANHQGDMGGHDAPTPDAYGINLAVLGLVFAASALDGFRTYSSCERPSREIAAPGS